MGHHLGGDDGAEALNPDNLMCRAIRAIDAGACSVALIVYGSLSRSGRVGIGTGGVMEDIADERETVHGATVAARYAMFADRHVFEFGTTAEQLAARHVEHDHLVPDAHRLEGVTPIYETMPGWQEDTSQVRSYAELPEAARAYLKRLEQLTGVEIVYVSVGTRREQIIER